MRNRRRIFNLLVACIATWLSTVAFAGAPIPATRPMYFEHLTMRDGPSMSTINSILQDSQGYAWPATQAGLNRYDGSSVRQFGRDRGNPGGLASDYVWSIAEDAQGDLWLATDGGGVARWERRTESFQQFRHDPKQPQSLASDTVRALLIDSKGLIWAGTKDHGLDILDPRTGTARHYRHRDSDAYSLPSDAIGALYTDHEGRIWVGSDGGLSRYDAAADGFVTYGEAMTAARGSDLRRRAIREDHNGALWIGTVNDGLARLDQNGGRFNLVLASAGDPPFLSHHHAWAGVGDAAKRVWGCTAHR